MKMYREAARDLPVTDEVDCLVVGSGPAGIGAALAAARNGAQTMIVEQFNCLGGMATSGMMSHFTGSMQSPFFNEVMEAMRRNPSVNWAGASFNPGNHCIHHEALKSALFTMLGEAGVKIRLYTFCCGAVVENDKVGGIIYESKSGRGVIRAKVVLDCTGDGDVAAHAGAEFQKGREGDGVCQPVTLMFRIAGVDYSRAIFPGSFESYMQVPAGEIQSLGKSHLPFPAGHVLLYATWLPGEVCVNMTNVIGIDGTNADDLTRAECVCREQIDRIVPFLREFAPGYENCYLVASAQNVGVRETRHIKGVYTITAEDIVEAKVFDDWIAARNYFNFDIHNTQGHGLDANGAQKQFRAKGHYTIPYRACVPVKLDGLLIGGRAISGTHKAHSNFRVMAICLNIGHGIGVAAATAVKHQCEVRDVDTKEIQSILLASGVEL